MKLLKSVCAVILPLLFLDPSFADTPANVTLPAKTLVLLEVVNHLKSGVVYVGDDVVYRVAMNVYGPNHELLIPAGAEAHGKVTKSDRAGMAGKSGKLNFTCDYVIAPDKTHVAFFKPDLSKAGRSYNAVGGVLFAGPLSLLGKGKNIDVDEGSLLAMATDADTTLVPIVEANVPSEQFVTVVPRKGRKFSGTVKAFDVETLVITSDGKDRPIKLKDVRRLTFTNAVPEK